jgi:putative transposase
MWACDFLHVHDVFFRPLVAFFITELGSRRVIHVGVTRSPTDTWVAQQLREATAFGQAPQYLIHDNDAKYGVHFTAVATGTGMEVLRTPINAPRANAVCERLLGSVRRECLDHLLIRSETHLRRVLGEYVTYFNCSRPHQGINQQVPEHDDALENVGTDGSHGIAFPVLGWPASCVPMGRLIARNSAYADRMTLVANTGLDSRRGAKVAVSGTVLPIIPLDSDRT